TTPYAAHVTPEAKPLPDRVQPTGYTPNGPTWLLGENLGWGTGLLSTPLSIVVGWLNSPAHRQNVLHPTFQDIRIGINEGSVTSSGQTGTLYVADFGMRATPVDTLRIRG